MLTPVKTVIAVLLTMVFSVHATMVQAQVPAEQASLADLVRRADSIFVAKVVASSLRGSVRKMSTSDEGSRPTNVVVEVTEKFKGSFENQTRIEVILPDTLVTEGQTVLWFLPAIPASREVRPLFSNGNMRITKDADDPSMLVAYGENKNRGLWGNNDDDSLWKIVNSKRFWDQYGRLQHPSAPKSRVSDVASVKCAPNPVPLDLLRAAIRALNDSPDHRNPDQFEF